MSPKAESVYTVGPTAVSSPRTGAKEIAANPIAAAIPTHAAHIPRRIIIRLLREGRPPIATRGGMIRNDSEL
jgi:hypothetical protein